MKKTTENLEFQISSLRQDKIILAVEAGAINITCLVASSLLGLLANLGIGSSMILYFVNIGIFVLAIGYTIYMLITNGSRLRQIKELTKQLEYR